MNGMRFNQLAAHNPRPKAMRACIARGIGVVVGLSLLTALLASPAEAQTVAVSLQCNQSVYFAPRGVGYQNVVSVPASSNPSVAQGSGSVGNPASQGGRRPGGTDGGITITAGGQEGTATITYSIENFSGERSTISVAVQVSCPPKQPKKERHDPPSNPPPDPPAPPNPGPGPQPPKQKEPPAHLTMTHRTTSCEACRAVAEDLNHWIDLYNNNPEFPGAVFIIRDLANELDDCEKKCAPPATVLTTPNENAVINVLRAPTFTPVAPVPIMPLGSKPVVVAPKSVIVTPMSGRLVGPKPSVVAPAPTIKTLVAPPHVEAKTTAHPRPKTVAAPGMTRVFTGPKQTRIVRGAPARTIFAAPQVHRTFAPVTAVRPSAFTRALPRTGSFGNVRRSRDTGPM